MSENASTAVKQASDQDAAREFKQKQRKSTRKLAKMRWQIYLLLAIPVIYVFIFNYLPMAGLVIAFQDFDYSKGIFGSPFVGLENFEKFFGAYNFKQILTNTLTISFYSLMTFPIPIVFALLLNSIPSKRYGKLIQTVTYIPHFISTVVMVGLIFQILNFRTGLYGSLYQMIMKSTAPDLLAKGVNFKHIYVWSGVWQSTGYNAIIYIAALSGVDPSLHEVATIDGASRLKRIRYIDLPAILPTVSIMLILAVGNIMNVGFEKVLLMQNDLNSTYSEIISTYVYRVGLASGVNDFSFSTAISMFNSVINFVLLVTANFISRRTSGSGIF